MAQLIKPGGENVIRSELANGANGLFAGGTSGLGPLLTDKQWERSMEIAYDEVQDSVPLLGGIITTSTGRAIERIRILERMGYRHMVVTSTFYVTPTREEEFLTHFGGCREATDMNMVLYNIPSCTNASIPITTIAEMAQRGWSRIVKESSGDRDYFLALVKAVSESETTVLQGNEPDIAWGLSVGAKGLVPVCGNYAPSLFCTAWRTHQAGDEARLVALQKQIMAIRETLLMGDKSWLAGAMYGVHTLGIGGGIVPRPIPELNAEQKREIDVLTESDAVLQLTDG